MSIPCTNYNFHPIELIFPYNFDLFYKLCVIRDKTNMFLIIIVRILIYYYLLQYVTQDLWRNLFYILIGLSIVSLILVFLKQPLLKEQDITPPTASIDSNGIDTRDVGPSIANKTLMPEVITPQNLPKSIS